MSKKNKIETIPAKGRPTLHWICEKPSGPSILERFEGEDFSLKKRSAWRTNRKRNSRKDR